MKTIKTYVWVVLTLFVTLSSCTKPPLNAPNKNVPFLQNVTDRDDKKQESQRIKIVHFLDQNRCYYWSNLVWKGNEWDIQDLGTYYPCQGDWLEIYWLPQQNLLSIRTPYQVVALHPLEIQENNFCDIGEVESTCIFDFGTHYQVDIYVNDSFVNCLED